jgi:hypothetical protein
LNSLFVMVLHSLKFNLDHRDGHLSNLAHYSAILREFEKFYSRDETKSLKRHDRQQCKWAKGSFREAYKSDAIDFGFTRFTN